MATAIMLKHPETGFVKKGYYGFSWTSFFFCGIPAIIRGDVGVGILIIVGSMLSCGLVGVIWAFIYNKRYTRNLIKNGYLLCGTAEEVKAACRALGIAEGESGISQTVASTNTACTASGKSPESQKTHLPRKHLCSDDKKYLTFDNVDEKISNEQFRPALRQLDGFLPVPETDEDFFINAVEECFYGLANGKMPQAALALYDELREKSAAFAAVTEDGPTGEMVSCFAECLDNALPPKGKAAAAVTIARSEHPLVGALRTAEPYKLVEFLDTVAEEVFDDWASGDLPDIPDGDLLEKLCALLEGRTSPEALEAEFAAIVQAKADAPLPEGNTLRVQSRSTRGRFYDLNLDELTCTCQDWQEKRTTQPKTMPGRLCKHLLSAVLDKPDILPPHLAQFYALFEPVAREGRGMPVPSPRLSVCYGVRDNGTPFVLTHEPGSPWANVIVQGQRYGYNAEEDHWSYQRVPEDAAFWKKKLAELG